jgi:2-polyprenyl-6-methoxyphenol hydroxylase-like FAD-dependent oxidoreductase
LLNARAIMAIERDVDVLVVGAGPTGLTLAGELLRRGVRARVIDKAAAPTTQSRALGVHARTLEIFDDFGIADELVSRGLRVEGATMRARERVVLSVDFTGLDTRFPFVLCVSQAETESVLAELLRRRGGSVERGKELVRLSQDADGVEAVIQSESGEERVRASWIVGSDGAHSAVRHAVGADFSGHTYEETFVLADVCMDWDLTTTRISTYFAEEGVIAFFPIRGGRWRVIVTAGEALGDTPALDAIAEVVSRRVGRAVRFSDSAWLTPFRIHCRQVDRYRHGRAFLAGDAAHIHSPIGGQGMNTGIHDAHNLAWKLALVTHGLARPELLDSYHAERHATGKNVLAQTDFATKMGTLKGLLVPIRNQLASFVTSFEPVRNRIVRETSELSVGYPNSPIVGERTSSTLGARLGKPDAAETPTVASRWSFSRGPGPGARAPDGAVRRDGDAEATRLARICDGRVFTLLLFDGRSPSEAGYAKLASIASRVGKRFGERVASFVVTPRAERPSALPADVPVIFDEADELEARYGAATECLYLVRPDLYVGFRCQPADGDALLDHLATILK